MEEIKMICHLHADIFDIVKQGIKNVEVRVNDEKRRKLKVGDNILFINRGNEEETLTLKVIGLEYYDNFEELTKHYDIERMYLRESTKEEFVHELERFYTKEEQEKYGVVAILFEMV